MLRHRSLAATGAALLALLSPRALRADDTWAPGPVEVRDVRIAGVLEISRGDARETLWLAGIDAAGNQDGSLSTRAAAATQAWISAGPVELIAPRPRPRGGIEGLLRLSDGSLLNDKLVREGFAIYEPDALGESFSRQLRTLQAEARRANVGVWSMRKIDVSDTPAPRNQLVTLCGPVDAVKTREADADHIHLGGSYPRNLLTLEVAPELRAAVAPMVRTDQEVCATGRLVKRDVAPAIAVVDATQVRERRPKPQ